MSNTPVDPMAMFREFVTQWETLANDVGSKILGSSEAAQVMHSGTSMSLKAQQIGQEAMAKGLAAANMPSKADIVALGERLSAIEAQLARIEMVVSGRAASAPSVDVPKPKRTKTPPPKAS
ncbi:MAG: hypothetical protein ACKVOJ_07725 [Sphingomonadaceae bacterium]